MSTDLIETDQGVLTKVSTTGDSLDVIFAENFIRLQRDTRADREWLDDVRGMFRNLLTARGLKSLKVATPRGEVRMKLFPRTVLHCGCHGLDPALCATAIAGEPVSLHKIAIDPGVSVNLMSEPEEAAA